MNIKQTLLTFLFILFSVAFCNAQEYIISTDRPDQSDGVQIVPKNKFQIENGILFYDETLLNNFMVRYGITNSTEIRPELDAGKAFEQFGLQPVTVNLK